MKKLTIKYNAVNSINDICNENNLNLAAREYLTKHFLNLINEKKHGVFFPTNDYNRAVTYDTMGIPFGVKLSDEYLNVIKKIFSFANGEEAERMYKEYIKKQHFLDIDYYEYCVNHPDIKPENIGLLSIYVDNLNTFNEFLSILDNCEEETTKLILDIIKPISIEMYKDSQEYRNYISLFSAESVTPLETAYLRRHNRQNDGRYLVTTNIRFIREFEYLFTSSCKLIKLILEAENSRDLLKEIRSIKLNVISKCPLGERIVETHNEGIYEEYWDRYSRSMCSRCVGVEKVTSDHVDFKNSEIQEIKEETIKSIVHLLNLDVEDNVWDNGLPQKIDEKIIFKRQKETPKMKVKNYANQ